MTRQTGTPCIVKIARQALRPKYTKADMGVSGLIVTCFFHRRKKAQSLMQNRIKGAACKKVCGAGIDLPRLIKEIHARIQDEDSQRPAGGSAYHRSLVRTQGQDEMQPQGRLIRSIFWLYKPGGF